VYLEKFDTMTYEQIRIFEILESIANEKILLHLRVKSLNMSNQKI